MENSLKKFSFIYFVLIIISFWGCSSVDENPSANQAFFEDNGYLTEPKYKKIVVDGVIPEVVGVGLDSSLSISPTSLALGNLNDVHHEIFLRVRLEDFLLDDALGNDSAKMFLTLTLDDDYYDSAEVYVDDNFDDFATLDDSLSAFDSLSVSLDWYFEVEKKATNLEEYSSSYPDSSWNHSMINLSRGLTPDLSKSHDSLFTATLIKTDVDDQFDLEFPKELIEEMNEAIKDYDVDDFNARLHIRITPAGEYNKIVRFSGISDLYYPPVVRYDYYFGEDMFSDSLSIYRSAHAGWIDVEKHNNLYGDDLVLHASLRESLYFRLSNDLIDSILDAEYGDKIAQEGEIENNLVVLSSVIFVKTNDNGFSERGLPLPIYSYTDVDSVGDDFNEKYILESRYLDSLDILENGHSNLLFYTSDSVALQFSSAIRHQVNTNAIGESSHMFVKMAMPVLQPKEYLRYNHYNDDSDYITVNSSYNDFASYNFGPADEWNFRLELAIMDFFVEEGE